jgi:hypothetical protein
MKSEKHIKLGQQTAITSFMLGTGIFGLYFATSFDGLLFVGYIFILLTGLINIGIIISILLKANKDKENRRELLKTCVVMLLNIPVMNFYCWVTIILTNTMRITLTNLTKTTLTNIKIFGCETKHIDKLEVGQRKTVWVGITGDCSVNIDYLTNEQRKIESVASYVTNNMGQKMEYNIGGQNEEEF